METSLQRATEYKAMSVAMRDQTHLLHAILKQLPIAQPEDQTCRISKTVEEPKSQLLGTTSRDIVRVTGSSPFGTGCRQHCRCVCHSYSTVKTPSFIKGALGSLFLKFSGFPILTSRCDNTTCAKAKASGVKFDYFFPSWLCSRRLIAQYTTSDLQAPELRIRVPRVRPRQSDIFNMARLGDVDGLKTLFEKGLASPYDVDSSGITALHVSLARQHFDEVENLTMETVQGICPQARDSDDRVSHSRWLRCICW